jgi:hypothetical protein
MTEVLRIFSHDHNPLAVAAQEYELAKEHHREMLRRDFRNPGHQQRFADAQERLEAARETYLRLMVLQG